MRASIVVPTYNRKERLRQCINALLKQNFDDYELVIVDDGSTDGTEEMVKDLQKKNIIYLKQENKGPSAARNFGVEKSNGKFIAFTDDDCIVEKNWLKELLKGFDNKNVGIVGGNYVFHDEKGFISLWQKCNMEKSIEGGRFKKPQFFESNNMAILKELFVSVAGFNPIFGPNDGSEDLNLNYQIIKKGFGLTFRENARVLHLHKKTLKGVLKQYYIAGRGDIVFMFLNKEKRIFRPHYLLLIPLVALKNALKQTAYAPRGYLPIFSLLNFLCLLYHQFGKVVRSISIKKPLLFLYNANKSLLE